MNKSILARNLSIHGQLEEITKALSADNIPVILLKGIALIELFPDYMGKRNMEDIDLLFRKQDISKARCVLQKLGYAPAPEDPWAFTRRGSSAYIDIIDELWYMDNKETDKLWLECPRCKVSETAFHLPPDEFFLHIFAHAYIHHAQMESKWVDDLNLLRSEWGIKEETLNRRKLDSYGFAKLLEDYAGNKKGGLHAFIRNSSIPSKGHILRFLYLPARKKMAYLAKTLFPSGDFLAYRYNLKGWVQLFIFRLLRPFLLLWNLLRFAGRFITSLKFNA